MATIPSLDDRARGGLYLSEIAKRFGITVTDVEWHFAGALRVLMTAMDEKDPWWWRFRL